MIKPESKGEFVAGIHPSAIISNSARLGENVTIGPYCVIGDEVEIGDGSVSVLPRLSRSGRAWAKNAGFINLPQSVPPRKI